MQVEPLRHPAATATVCHLVFACPQSAFPPRVVRNATRVRPATPRQSGFLPVLRSYSLLVELVPPSSPGSMLAAVGALGTIHDRFCNDRTAGSCTGSDAANSRGSLLARFTGEIPEQQVCYEWWRLIADAPATARFRSTLCSGFVRRVQGANHRSFAPQDISRPAESGLWCTC